MHFCSHCGHEIPHREKFCQQCGTRVEYLCAVEPLPAEPPPRRPVQAAASITKWIVLYLFVVCLSFGLSFLYYSSPELFSWSFPFGQPKTNAVDLQPESAQRSPAAVKADSSGIAIKNAFNSLSAGVQRATQLIAETGKVNVAGDPKRTAANYRSIHNGSDAMLSQLTFPPDISAEVGAVAMPLKEALSLLSKSSLIMADYLDGKLSLAPPNPDWLGRSQEYFVQSQARLKEAQQALAALRKKIEKS